MKHVFVETNWVVAYGAPEHVRVFDAVNLLQRAQRGELRLYLPSICLTEARNPIQTRFHPRMPADSLRKYLTWAGTQTTVPAGEIAIARRLLDQYESSVLAELQGVPERLQALRDSPVGGSLRLDRCHAD